MKPKFDNTINWGHILIALSFLGPALLYGVSLASEQKVLRTEVNRHEALITRMQEIDLELIKNQQIIATRLSDHIEAAKTLNTK